MKFMNKFYQFMQGRYGIDEFYYFLIYCYFFLTCFCILFKIPFLFFLQLLLFVFLTYRVFSKNITNRKRENQFYLKRKEKIKSFFQDKRRNWKDRKDFIYKTYHKCKTVLRIPLPNKRGFKYLTCPKCKNRWRVFSFRREKIEITKANGKKIYR